MSQQRIAELEEKILRLEKINRVLMDRVEHSMDLQGDAFSIFQTAVLLEDKVRERTLALEGALDDLGTTRRFLHEAIEIIDEGFALFDGQDRLVLCNERYRQIWGGAPILGMSFEQLLRQLAPGELLPDAHPDPEQWIARRLAHHRHPHDPVVIRSSDGRWLQISERRTVDGGIVSLYTDITEVKRRETHRRERELAEKSVLLQSTLDNLAQGVSVVDGRGRLVAWNQRFVELLALSKEAVATGIHLDDLPGMGELLAQLPDDVAIPCAADYQTPSHLMLGIRRSAMPGGGLVYTYADITDRKTKERQLVQAVDRLSHANTELERFAYVASHDLREPLRTIVSFTQLLQRKLPLEGENQEFFNLIVGAGNRMHDLIGGLLDYSRASGQSSPFRPCDLSKVTALALENLRGSIEQTGASITASELPTVMGDAVQLMQLLQNLLGNAIKYRHPDIAPLITLSAERQDGEWRIAVTDNGIGVEETGQDIYEIFRRLHHSAAYPGAGIGLAVCRRIVQHHGGRLWHEPAPGGSGTVFLFTLPVG